MKTFKEVALKVLGTTADRGSHTYPVYNIMEIVDFFDKCFKEMATPKLEDSKQALQQED